MPKASRQELIRILETTENTLKKNWDGYEGFEELQERISRLYIILDEASDNGSNGLYKTISNNLLEIVG